MTVLHTPQELLSALAGSVFAADPIADLAHRGFTMSQGLHHQLQQGLAGRKPVPPPPGVTPASIKGSLTFQQAPRITPSAPPPDGSYDVVAGLTIAAADLALDAVFQSGTIPHQFALDELLSPGDLSSLESFFRVDKPGGHISRLHFTGPPTLAPIPGTIGNNSVVALKIPFRLDWSQLHVILGRRIHQLITTAKGTLQLTMKLVADIPTPPGSPMTMAVQFASVTSAADSPRLTLDSDSPVKLVNPPPANQPDALAVQIQTAVAKQLKNSLSVGPVSPKLALPIGNLTVRQADVVTDGQALLAGVRVWGGPTQNDGKPANLRNLLTSPNDNIFIQMQGGVLDGLIRDALASGLLTAYARLDQSNAVVDTASGSFQNNGFAVQFTGRLVDECPLNIDLGFTGTTTVTITPKGDCVDIDRHNDYSVSDLSNWPCLLATLGIMELWQLGAALYDGSILHIAPAILGVLSMQVGRLAVDQILSGRNGSPTCTPLDQPIPGSDFLPTLTGGTISITDGALLMTSQVDKRPDDINTIIYARFVVPEGDSVINTKPLAGVTVELMDQDAPAPRGDDPQINIPPDRKIGRITERYSLEKPRFDEQMGVSETDLDGIVRFGLLRSELTTTAGDIKREIVDPVTGVDPDHTTVTTITEAKPDLYFRVRMPDGSVVDTRQLPGGFMKNFTSARVGSPSNPLTFTLGPGTPVVIGTSG